MQWRLIFFGVILLAVIGIFWRLHYLENENDRLDRELSKANVTIAAQENILKRNRELQKKENDAIDQIEAAPESDDGPIAPVLRRTLDGL